MQLRKKTITISILLMVAAFILFGCQLGSDGIAPAWFGNTGTSEATEPKESGLANYTTKGSQTVAYFSTVSSLILHDDFSDPGNILRFEEVWTEINLILDRINKAVSISAATSDIARFNALNYGESIRISNDTANICKVAREAFDATGGMYDPTVMPLVDLWGFTPRFNTKEYAPLFAYDRMRNGTEFELPDDKYVAAFLKLVDFSKVILSGDDQKGYTLTKLIPPVTIDGVQYNAQLDFGGLAKGYAVDCVARLLQDRGYAYGSFSCGGSSILLLKNASARSRENETYRFMLGLSKPRKGASDERIYMSIAKKDIRLSSSGDYDHSYLVGGIIYSHIINPKTGYPMNTPAASKQKGIAVLTFMSGNAAYDDTMTTALCVMGFEKALRFFNENLKDYQMTMVLYNAEHSFYEVLTNIPSDEFTISDSSYVLASHVDADRNIVYDGSLLR